jgi:hypothetical protein
MFGQPFFNDSLRKYVVLFATLFNNIYLVKRDALGNEVTRSKVPIAFGPKEKWYERITQDPTLIKSVMVTTPRLSFEMIGMSYDETRAQQATLRHRGTAPVSGTTTQSQYVATSYNFDFNLSLYVRNIEDGAQIIEQILPYFHPDFTISALLSPDMGITKDIPITLNSVNQSIEYEGPIENVPRLITWDLAFTLKGYFFGPTASAAQIYGRTANTGGIFVNYYTTDPGEVQLVSVANTGTLGYTEGEVVRVANTDIYGTVVYYHANTLTIRGATGVIKIGQYIQGDQSGTRYKANTVEKSAIRVANTHIVQKPLSANQYSDFGYTITTQEFPYA